MHFRYLHIWNASLAVYQEAMSAPKGEGAPNSRARLMSWINKGTYPNGEYVAALAVFGSMELQSDPMTMTSAKVGRQAGQVGRPGWQARLARQRWGMAVGWL